MKTIEKAKNRKQNCWDGRVENDRVTHNTKLGALRGAHLLPGGGGLYCGSVSGRGDVAAGYRDCKTQYRSPGSGRHLGPRLSPYSSYWREERE